MGCPSMRLALVRRSRMGARMARSISTPAACAIAGMIPNEQECTALQGPQSLVQLCALGSFLCQDDHVFLEAWPCNQRMLGVQ